MKSPTIVGWLAAGTALVHAAENPAPKPEEKPLPGHSLHGEAFNEGPRQAAILMEGMGNAHLAVTTRSEAAQKFFDQGLNQLHGFWYWEAERSFRQAAALDADCAMAYWGMAMANINNQTRAAQFIKEAAKRKDKAGRREQLYIGAWADYYAETKKDERVRREGLIKSLEELSFEFPDDLEAKAFLVFQLWDNKNHSVPIPSRQAVDALAQQVLAVNPMHPGVHHYLIHLWNGNNGDKRALPAAARGGQAAPGIAHLWHMPGHTFSDLKRYADAAWQQEASARVDHAYMQAARILPDQIHNFAHNNDWLVKNLAYVGRVHDGTDLAKNMIELPRPGSKSGKSYKLGRERLLEMLEQFELWDELTSLEETIYLASPDDPLEEVRRLRALGVAWFTKGDATRGQAKLEALKTLQAAVREERIKAADDAEAKAKSEKKRDDEVARAMAEALRTFSYRVATTKAAIADLRMTRALATGNHEAAKAQLELATDLSAMRRARIQLALGNKEQAEKLARDAARADEAQILPQATLVHVLAQIGKKDEALTLLKKVRERSASCDLEVPAFARLAPLVQELQWPADWRVAATVAADAGTRPNLASLGPFRWRPFPAPGWSLSDQQGRQVSLADFRGKPVLVVFYLGSGCTGCIEQLNVLAPQVQAFAEAGVQVVAVSTDSADGLHKTFAKAKTGLTFAFPILADPTHGAFKAYRAFDDFENMPLHGVFLVDGGGSIRWQDIGYQPFRDVPWLLGEAKRLLSVPANRLEITATGAAR